MKKIGVCVNCEREVYTNDMELCKKCNQEVGLDFINKQEIEEEMDEEEPTFPESMVLEEGSDEDETAEEDSEGKEE